MLNTASNSEKASLNCKSDTVTVAQKKLTAYRMAKNSTSSGCNKENSTTNGTVNVDVISSSPSSCIPCHNGTSKSNHRIDYTTDPDISSYIFTNISKDSLTDPSLNISIPIITDLIDKSLDVAERSPQMTKVMSHLPNRHKTRTVINRSTCQQQPQPINHIDVISTENSLKSMTMSTVPYSAQQHHPYQRSDHVPSTKREINYGNKSDRSKSDTHLPHLIYVRGALIPVDKVTGEVVMDASIIDELQGQKLGACREEHSPFQLSSKITSSQSLNIPDLHLDNIDQFLNKHGNLRVTARRIPMKPLNIGKVTSMIERGNANNQPNKIAVCYGNSKYIKTTLAGGNVVSIAPGGRTTKSHQKPHRKVDTVDVSRSRQTAASNHDNSVFTVIDGRTGKVLKPHEIDKVVAEGYTSSSCSDNSSHDLGYGLANKDDENGEIGFPLDGGKVFDAKQDMIEANSTPVCTNTTLHQHEPGDNLDVSSIMLTSDSDLVGVISTIVSETKEQEEMITTNNDTPWISNGKYSECLSIVSENVPADISCGLYGDLSRNKSDKIFNVLDTNNMDELIRRCKNLPYHGSLEDAIPMSAHTISSLFAGTMMMDFPSELKITGENERLRNEERRENGANEDENNEIIYDHLSLHDDVLIMIGEDEENKILEEEIENSDVNLEISENSDFFDSPLIIHTDCGAFYGQDSDLLSTTQGKAVDRKIPLNIQKRILANGCTANIVDNHEIGGELLLISKTTKLSQKSYKDCCSLNNSGDVGTLYHSPNTVDCHQQDDLYNDVDSYDCNFHESSNDVGSNKIPMTTILPPTVEPDVVFTTTDIGGDYYGIRSASSVEKSEDVNRRIGEILSVKKLGVINELTKATKNNTVMDKKTMMVDKPLKNIEGRVIEKEMNLQGRIYHTVGSCSRPNVLLVPKMRLTMELSRKDLSLTANTKSPSSVGASGNKKPTITALHHPLYTNNCNSMPVSVTHSAKPSTDIKNINSSLFSQNLQCNPKHLIFTRKRKRHHGGDPSNTRSTQLSINPELLVTDSVIPDRNSIKEDLEEMTMKLSSNVGVDSNLMFTRHSRAQESKGNYSTKIRSSSTLPVTSKKSNPIRSMTVPRKDRTCGKDLDNLRRSISPNHRILLKQGPNLHVSPTNAFHLDVQRQKSVKLQNKSVQIYEDGDDLSDGKKRDNSRENSNVISTYRDPNVSRQGTVREVDGVNTGHIPTTNTTYHLSSNPNPNPNPTTYHAKVSQFNSHSIGSCCVQNVNINRGGLENKSLSPPRMQRVSAISVSKNPSGSAIPSQAVGLSHQHSRRHAVSFCVNWSSKQRLAHSLAAPQQVRFSSVFHQRNSNHNSALKMCSRDDGVDDPNATDYYSKALNKVFRMRMAKVTGKGSSIDCMHSDTKKHK